MRIRDAVFTTLLSLLVFSEKVFAEVIVVKKQIIVNHVYSIYKERGALKIRNNVTGKQIVLDEKSPFPIVVTFIDDLTFSAYLEATVARVGHTVQVVASQSVGFKGNEQSWGFGVKSTSNSDALLINNLFELSTVIANNLYKFTREDDHFDQASVELFTSAAYAAPIPVGRAKPKVLEVEEVRAELHYLPPDLLSLIAAASTMAK